MHYEKLFIYLYDEISSLEEQLDDQLKGEVADEKAVTLEIIQGKLRAMILLCDLRAPLSAQDGRA